MDKLVREHEIVVLKKDVPEEGLKAGDVGVVLLVHEGGAETPPGYTVEFTTVLGDTVAVVDLTSDSVRSIAASDVRHARPVSLTI